MKDSMHIINNETVTLKISRAHVIRLLQACTAVADSFPDDKESSREMWQKIREEVKDQLGTHDLKAISKGWRE